MLIPALWVAVLLTGYRYFALWIRGRKDVSRGRVTDRKITVERIELDKTYGYESRGVHVGDWKYRLLDQAGNAYRLSLPELLRNPEWLEGQVAQIGFLENTGILASVSFHANGKPLSQGSRVNKEDRDLLSGCSVR